MAAGEKDGTERKTRSLRKYEADSDARLADGEAPALELLSPFGPMIAKTEVALDLVESINRFADRHVRERESTEFLLPPSWSAPAARRHWPARLNA